jgi:molybdopterin-guanine dinucleotide biosynthesis protein MobB
VKVIPVAGTSGSGKTSFILTLLPLLSRHGPTGAVKHIGHHAMELPEGKDTTVMFDTGARAVAGIDGEKTILTLRDNSLPDALDLLAGQGVAFAVVEGFKGSPWPKVVIGDLEAEEVLLRNPSPEEVIRNLGRFPDYVTLGELLRELGEACREQGQASTTATATIPLPAGMNEDSLELPALVRGMEALSGVTGARAALRHGALFGGTDELLVAVAAESGEEAALALQLALPGCPENPEAAGDNPG